MNPQVEALKAKNLNWPICWAGVELIASRESCRLRAYKNFPKEPWTCGWGETEGVGPNTVWTQEYADQRFVDSLTVYRDFVLAACTIEPDEHQLAAMVSLCYNIGKGWSGKRKPAGAKDGFLQSTVLRQHNASKFEAAARAFGRWNIANGKENPGLVARRMAEAALYLQPVPGAQPDPMSQAVEPENKLKQSPIAQSGAATVGVGIIGMLGNLGEQLTAFKATFATARSFVAETLGVPTEWVMPILVIGLGATIIMYRRNQHKDGWA